ncbi:hypothetical protein HYR99_09200 [Candidatus Poribacteria bacterium]|nr:hypothetical protein [Candidatus Poribacteria bacterium]
MTIAISIPPITDDNDSALQEDSSGEVVEAAVLADEVTVQNWPERIP